MTLKAPFTKPSYPFASGRGSTLSRLLVLAYQSAGSQAIIPLAESAGINLANINTDRAPRTLWNQLLRAASPALKLEALIEAVLADRNSAKVHRAISELTGVELSDPQASEDNEGTDQLDPPFDEPNYPWDTPKGKELYELLVAVYKYAGRDYIINLAEYAGIDRAAINIDRSPGNTWRQLLNLAARSDKLKALFEQILMDPQGAAVHPRVSVLTGLTLDGDEEGGGRKSLAGRLRKNVTDLAERSAATGSTDNSLDGLETTISDSSKWTNSMAWLRGGLLMAPRIAQISVDNEPAGTGFLVGKEAVITNAHVVDKLLDFSNGLRVESDAAQRVQLRFDYVDLDGKKTASEPVSLAAMDPIPAASPKSDLDFALLHLSKRADTDPIDHLGLGIEVDRGTIVLSAAEPRADAGDLATVIQHPQDSPGLQLDSAAQQPQQIAFENDGFVGEDASGKKLYHRVKTETGSSGSPVFNIDWELVGLHRGWDISNVDGETVNVASPIDLVMAAIKAQKADHLLSKDESSSEAPSGSDPSNVVLTMPGGTESIALPISRPSGMTPELWQSFMGVLIAQLQAMGMPDFEDADSGSEAD